MSMYKSLIQIWFYIILIFVFFTGCHNFKNTNSGITSTVTTYSDIYSDGTETSSDNELSLGSVYESNSTTVQSSNTASKGTTSRKTLSTSSNPFVLPTSSAQSKESSNQSSSGVATSSKQSNTSSGLTSTSSSPPVQLFSVTQKSFHEWPVPTGLAFAGGVEIKNISSSSIIIESANVEFFNQYGGVFNSGNARYVTKILKPGEIGYVWAEVQVDGSFSGNQIKDVDVKVTCSPTTKNRLDLDVYDVELINHDNVSKVTFYIESKYNYALKDVWIQVTIFDQNDRFIGLGTYFVNDIKIFGTYEPFMPKDIGIKSDGFSTKAHHVVAIAYAEKA